MKKIWVTSGDPNKAKLLTDISNYKDSAPVAIDISLRMAKEGIGIQVEYSPFVEQMLATHDLERLIDEAKAKQDYDAYMKKLAKEGAALTEAQKDEKKAERLIADAAVEAYKKGLLQSENKVDPGARPKVIRHEKQNA